MILSPYPMPSPALIKESGWSLVKPLVSVLTLASKFFTSRQVKQEEKMKFIDMEDANRRVTDGEEREIIKKLSGVESAAELQAIKAAKRDSIIAKFKASGLSIRQNSRLTGISFGIVRTK